MSTENEQSLTNHEWMQVDTHEFPEVLATVTAFDVLEIQSESHSEVEWFKHNTHEHCLENFLGDKAACRAAKKHAQIVAWSCDEYLEFGCC